MNLLELVAVEAGYRSKRVLHGVSLGLGYGEKLVVMGPSGSGKTTLLKVIPRLVEPWKGRIVFEGVDITRANGRELRRVRSQIGYLPQHYGLFLHMRVIDNIVFPLTVVKKVPREEALKTAEKLMKMLGIEELAYKYPAQLSGGQQQRVALARALAMNPKLLLLDEPTSALDPESRADVLEALYQVAKTGCSMVIVTHEVDFALETADRIAFMENGRIVVEGKPAEVLEHPRVKAFLERVLGTYHRHYMQKL